MRQAMPLSPINPLPAAVWVLALPAIAGEIAFLLGQTGLIGGALFKVLCASHPALTPLPPCTAIPAGLLTTISALSS